jgi:hypothetical protein
VLLAGVDRRGAGEARCASRGIEHGVQLLQACGSAAVVTSAEGADVVIGVRGAGHLPEAEAGGVVLLVWQVTEHHEVGFRLDGQDRHALVGPEIDNLRGGDVRLRRLGQCCTAASPAVHEEAVVFVHEGLDGVDIRGEAERGL